MMAAFLILVIVACVCGWIGSLLGRVGDRNNEVVGFLLGLLTGPVGWLITVLLPPNTGRHEIGHRGVSTAAKIKALERQLEALRREHDREAAEARRDGRGTGAGGDDDGEVPTYRLD